MGASLRLLLVALGLLCLLVATLAAFGLPVFDSLRLLFEGSLADRFGIARTLVKATPLLLCGFGMLLAWRAGIYNIGGEGQLLAGALCGAWAYRTSMGMPNQVMWAAVLAASVLGGAAMGTFAGWLQVRRGVLAVISTILLNFIAIQAVGWAASGPLRESRGRVPLTDRIPSEAMLPRIGDQTDLHLGVALAALVAIGVGLWVSKSLGGFRLRVVGENANAARAARMDPGRVQVMAMLSSGALCGLAGGLEYAGVAGQLGVGFSQNWGFIAIPVALLGGLAPVGVGLSALFFGALFAGSENLSGFTASGATVIFAMQGVAVLGYVALRAFADRRLVREEAA